jgi:tetratricopeptide (TPR) repeat protein
MDALYNLAWIYGANSKPEMRDEALAVQLAEKLCRLKKYKNPFALDVLAVAFANRGQFDKAISTAQKALEISKQNKMANLSTNIEKRLNLYKKNKPFRNPDKLTLPQKNCIENDFKNPTPNPSNKTYF